jgi:ATP-dependent Lon protease
MELIEVSGYTMEEKISIASKWVIPKAIKKTWTYN